MEIQQMRSFVTAAQTLNFNLAAAQLFIDQSTLSQHISLLEKDLGIKLFERGKNYSGVRLTSAGELLFPRIQSLLEDLDDVRNLAQRLQDSAHFRNVLTIGFDVRIIFTDVPKYLNQYMSQHPELHTLLHHAEEAELFRWLRSHVVDVGIAIHIPEGPIDGLNVCVLEKLPMCLAVHPTVLKKMGTDDPADILRVFPLYFNGNDQAGISHSIGVAQALGVTPNVVRCKNHLEVLSYVNAGQGVNICYKQGQLPTSQIVMLPIPPEYGELPVYGLLPAQHTSDNAREFLEHYKEFKNGQFSN